MLCVYQQHIGLSGLYLIDSARFPVLSLSEGPWWSDAAPPTEAGGKHSLSEQGQLLGESEAVAKLVPTKHATSEGVLISLKF